MAPSASYNSPLYDIEAQDEFLLVTRKFPPARREVPYTEIVSFEHRRLPSYRDPINAIIAMVLAYLVVFVGPIRKIIEQLILEAGNATGQMHSTTIDASVKALADPAITLLAGFLVVLAGYYMFWFFLSLRYRLVIYRTGRVPLSVPLPLTGDALQVLAKLKEKKEDAAPQTRKEVESMISAHLESLLQKRKQLETTLIESLRSQSKAAKTDEDKERVKKMMQEGIGRLEEHDQLIDRELKKTGLSKAEIFKKYHIRPPKEEFIDEVLESGGFKDLAGK